MFVQLRLLIAISLGLFVVLPSVYGSSVDLPEPPDLTEASVLGNKYYNWRSAFGLSEEELAVAVNIVDRKALMEALQVAKGGEVFVLAPGQYGNLNLKQQFDKPVMIASSNETDKAVFSHIKLSKVKGLRLYGLSIQLPPHEKGMKALFGLRIDGGENVIVEHCDFVGSVVSTGQAEGFGFGSGIFAGSLSHVEIKYNEFTRLGKCISFRESKKTNISNNYFHDYRSDAIYMSRVVESAVEMNIMENVTPFMLPKGKGDHPDFIQGMGISDIRIYGNFMNQGYGTSSQGIFIHGFKGEDDGVYRKGVIVENNIISLGMVNGIAVGNLPDSIIRNNTLVMNNHKKKNNWNTTLGISGAAGLRATIENNLVNKIAIRNDGNNPQHIIHNNKEIQRNDSEADNYYDKFLKNATADDKARLEDFRPVNDDQPGADFSIFESWLK